MDGEVPTLDIADYQRSVRLYCRDVLNGTIKAGRLERLAVRRQLRDLCLAGGRGFYFDSFAAAVSLVFFELCLKHSTGEWSGKPFILEPWQRFVLWCVFGWLRTEDGTRRFRFVYEELGRKNGKSALVAGVGLKLAKGDGEPRSEVYCIATKEDQSRLLFEEAVRMTKRVEEFADLARIYESQKPRIVFTDDESVLRPLGYDKEGAHGKNPHGVLIDELHAWRGQHVELYNGMTTGSDARRQPLFWTITTAGGPQSELWESKREAAIKAVEEVESCSVSNDELFAFVCAVDDDVDPLRPDLDDRGFRAWVESEAFSDTMRQANPNLGVSCKLRGLKSNAILARNDPTERDKFLRYNCNRPSSGVEKAIRPDLWRACAGPLTAEEWPHVEPRGGFDLGRSDDFCAATILFPIPTDEYETVKDEKGEERPVRVIRYEAISRAWTCEKRPERLDTPQFRRWVASERMEVHPGDQIDFTKVSADIVSWTRLYNVRSWAYDDSWAVMVAQSVKEETGLDLYPFYQTHKRYNEPTRGFLRLIKDQRRFRHDGDELLAWQADNLSIDRDANDRWKPEKAGSGERKIDGMVALIMAYSECLFHEKGDGPSVYDTEGRGFVTLG